MSRDLYLGDDGDAYSAPTEAYLRGVLTRAECDAELNDALTTTDEPVHTWGRWGFGTDEWGGAIVRCLRTSPLYAGQRGAFRVTVIGVRVTNAAP
jgi:hypothetical protein